MTTMIRNETLSHTALPSLARLAAAWAGFRATRRERARIVRELSACNDRDLAELGLFRHDIHAVANGTYRR